MKAATIAAIALLWSLFMGVCGFSLGYYIRGAREVTKEVQAERKDAKQKDRKDQKAFAAGVRTEQAQAKADTAFQRIRTDYESDQRKNPAAGCVLDPDSLRRWNEANAQSDGDAAAELDGEVPAAAEGEAGRERGQ